MQFHTKINTRPGGSAFISEKADLRQNLNREIWLTYYASWNETERIKVMNICMNIKCIAKIQGKINNSTMKMGNVNKFLLEID